jgi:hypothetical protein
MKSANLTIVSFLRLGAAGANRGLIRPLIAGHATLDERRRFMLIVG